MPISRGLGHSFIACVLILGGGLAVAPTLSAQSGTTLSGTVTQADSKAPMGGALVVIDELRREVHTAPDGTYTFDSIPPGEYHVGVRADGFTTRRSEVTVGSTPATLDIAVAFDLHFAEVLSVSPNARPQFESYQATSVLTGQDLAKQLEATIGATLSSEAGVATRALGAGASRPVIRGLDGDRVAVLQDGSRMGDLSSQSGDHGVTVNPASATKIEVVRGPATLLYGANAIGGLVNVITDQIPTAPTQGASGNFMLNAASNSNEAGGAGDVHVGNGAWALHFGGSANRTGNYSTPEGEVANAETRTSTVNVGASRTWAHSYAGVSYGYDDMKYGIPIVEDGQVSLTPQRHSITARVGATEREGVLQSYRGTLAVRRYQHSELTGAEVGTTFKNNTVEGELLLSHRKAGPLVGTVGGWFLTRDFNSIGEEALSPPVQQNAYAAFLYEEVTRPHVTLQFGGRFDHASYEPEGGLEARDFNEFSGSLGVLFKPKAANDNFVVAASLARAARYPALEELYFFGAHPGNFAFEVGNPDLESERALGVDVSVRVRGSRFEGEVSVFRNDISNFIFRNATGVEEDEFPVVEFLGLDSVLYGMEAHGDVKVTPELMVEFTFDMVRGELSGSDQALPRIPPYRGIVGLRYQKNALQFGGSVTAVAAQDRVYGDETPTAGYGTLRLYSSYSFTQGRMLNTITARLENATNELYRNHLNYLKDVLPEIGRTFRVLYAVGF